MNFKVKFVRDYSKRMFHIGLQMYVFTLPYVWQQYIDINVVFFDRFLVHIRMLYILLTQLRVEKFEYKIYEG